MAQPLIRLTPLARWENPLTGRYYQAAVQQNLFGDWELMRIWGGIGSARGRQWLVPVDPQAAGAALARIAVRRSQRGYQRVANVSPAHEQRADKAGE